MNSNNSSYLFSFLTARETIFHWQEETGQEEENQEDSRIKMRRIWRWDAKNKIIDHADHDWILNSQVNSQEKKGRENITHSLSVSVYLSCMLCFMFFIFFYCLLKLSSLLLRKKKNPFQRVGHWEEGNCKYPLIAPDGLSMKMSILWMQQKEESGRYEYEQ